MQVLALPNSKFYHIGTMLEYIDAFCLDRQLAKEMRFRDDGAVLCSIVADSVVVPETAVVEFCRIESDIEISPRTILSNCHVTKVGTGARFTNC
jgi:hypothetical protein